jgi:hypothetical protein
MSKSPPGRRAQDPLWRHEREAATWRTSGHAKGREVEALEEKPCRLYEVNLIEGGQ